MTCCDYNCNQGRACPARKASCACPEPIQGFDPIPEINNWDRITYWVATGIAAFCTLGVLAGALGFAYSKWIV